MASMEIYTYGTEFDNNPYISINIYSVEDASDMRDHIIHRAERCALYHDTENATILYCLARDLKEGIERLQSRLPEVEEDSDLPFVDIEEVGR